MQLTTATKLTVLRVILIPVLFVVLYWDFPGANWVSMLIFVAASITDALDGHIARKYNQVSNMGKFLDPLADKVLVTAAMCWFTSVGRFPAWALAAVLLREFAVSGLRLIAVERGRVIAAAWSGKIKTASTMVALCLMLVFAMEWLDWVCIAVIVITTVWSGVEYFYKNRDVFAE